MGVTIVGPDGEETPNRQEIVIPGYEIPDPGDDVMPGLEIEEGAVPGLEIRSPEVEPQQEQPPLLIPSTVFPVGRKVHKIFGDN
jgi:hypothetical protein